MTRRELRENVFKIVFRASFFDKEEMPEQVQEYLKDITEADGKTPSEAASAPKTEISKDKDTSVSPADNETEAEGSDEVSESERDIKYIHDKADKIIERSEEIDKMIEGAAKGWSLRRIGKAELAILRVAVYEIRYDDDIPFKVAVNEALELSKKYCEPEAGAFINGILSAFA